MKFKTSVMKKDYDGFLIKEDVWHDKKLTWMEKIFMSLIGDYTEASNRELSGLFLISSSRVSQIISSLREKEYISVKYLLGKNKQIEKRMIKKL